LLIPCHELPQYIVLVPVENGHSRESSVDVGAGEIEIRNLYFPDTSSRQQR